MKTSRLPFISRLLLSLVTTALLSAAWVGAATANCGFERWKRCTTHDPLLWTTSIDFVVVDTISTHRFTDATHVVGEWNLPFADVTLTTTLDATHTPTLDDDTPSISWTDLSGSGNPCSDCAVGATSCTCLTYVCPDSEIVDADIFIHDQDLDLGAPPKFNGAWSYSGVPHRPVLNHEVGHAFAFRDAPTSNTQVRAMVTTGHLGGWTGGVNASRVRPGPLEAKCLSEWYPNSNEEKDLTVNNHMMVGSASTWVVPVFPNYLTDPINYVVCPGVSTFDDVTVITSAYSLGKSGTTTEIRFYMSEDWWLDASDVYIGKIDLVLDPWEFYEVLFDTFTLPQSVLDCDTEYHVLAVIDEDDDVAEYNEWNNVVTLSWIVKTKPSSHCVYCL